MPLNELQMSRRTFLGTSSAVALAALGGAAADEPKRLPRVAAVNSIYRFRSHAYHIAGRFVTGYTRSRAHHQPPFQLVRMFNHQYPKDDLGREFCKRHKIELCDTVSATLGSAGKLDVDAVLLIIEHGEYPVNQRGQILYPRFEMFQEIVEVFRKSGRGVPVFVDKHLSYDHAQAAKMVATARELGFGLMAGSSLPVTWRMPEIEPPLGTKFREGLAVIGYDRGPAEIYLFHALEVLQTMLERRAGSETGVKSVVCLEGPAVWKAADAGRWSWKLLEAALAHSPSNNVGPIRENVSKPLAILIEYRDGTRGTVLNLIEQTSDFAFAGFVEGRPDPLAACFYLPPPPGARFFDPLVWNIEKFFASGKPPYPVERTLLTSTVLDLALRSLAEGSKPVMDAALDVRYPAPADSGFFRGTWTDSGVR
jgi:hypothetical protein